MKLRIHGNSLRLRLSRSEVEALAENDQVQTEIQFPGGARLVYALVMSDDTTTLACASGGESVTVLVPRGAGTEWAKTDAVGMRHEVDLEDGGKLTLLVEKDFKCLHKRPGEDESDNFPHPEAGSP